MKKLIYFVSVYLIYFGAVFLTLRVMLNYFEVDFMDYKVRSSGERFRDSVLFFSPFILMLLGEIAVFVIGRKLFEKWKLKEAFITFAVSAAGFISAVVTAALIFD